MAPGTALQLSVVFPFSGTARAPLGLGGVVGVGLGVGVEVGIDVGAGVEVGVDVDVATATGVLVAEVLGTPGPDSAGTTVTV